MTSPVRRDPRPALHLSASGQAPPHPASRETPIQTSPQSLTASRLRKHADYQRAYAASRKRQSSSMSWFLAPQTPAYTGAALPAGPRVGLTCGKVIGKAHERNRIKRRMREVLRRHVSSLPPGFDLILHPRRIVLALEFGKLEAEIVRILHQARNENQMRTEARNMPQQAQATPPRGAL
jgi:ribonuclease P protein component